MSKTKARKTHPQSTAPNSVAARVSDRRIVIVSNRIADPRRDEQAGGLAVALSDVLRTREGVWAGWSGRVSETAATDAPTRWRSGNTDFVALDLTEAERTGYYLGHANDCLWPLLHYRTDLMRFEPAHLAAYQAVNRRFADMVAPLLRTDDLVWVHDYHLFPLASDLRRRGVTAPIGFYLHIPFPSPQVMATLPQYRQLVHDLAAYDLVGVQTEQDRASVCATMLAEGAIELEDGRFRLGARTVTVAAFPVGIDVERFTRAAERGATESAARAVAGAAPSTALIIGVERLDYTKGLAERFKAYRRLLETHPENRRRVTFLQIAAKSREDVASYTDLQRELDRIVGAIQGDFADVDWSPVRYVRRSVARSRIASLYRSSRVGLVTPLRDGMNLVAKEYVAAQDPNDPGVLVLSKFAGAAEHMREAVIVNPYDTDGTADAIHRALHMPLAERQKRHAVLLAHIREADAAAWGRSYLRALSDVIHRPGQQRSGRPGLPLPGRARTAVSTVVVC
jgi:trehalose 6-phosphate synthase